MSTIKNVDFTNKQSGAILLSNNGQETGTKFIAFDVNLCVQICLHLAIMRRNSMSCDSESNNFANLSRISDKDFMEEDEEDMLKHL